MRLTRRASLLVAFSLSKRSAGLALLILLSLLPPGCALPTFRNYDTSAFSDQQAAVLRNYVWWGGCLGCVRRISKPDSTVVYSKQRDGRVTEFRLVPARMRSGTHIANCVIAMGERSAWLTGRTQSNFSPVTYTKCVWSAMSGAPGAARFDATSVTHGSGSKTTRRIRSWLVKRRSKERRRESRVCTDGGKDPANGAVRKQAA